jgi:hypothetical protein
VPVVALGITGSGVAQNVATGPHRGSGTGDRGDGDPDAGDDAERRRGHLQDTENCLAVARGGQRNRGSDADVDGDGTPAFGPR